MSTVPYVCVVDASAAAQLVVPEPLSAQAAQLFALLAGGQATFHVPDLFYVECASIFRKKVQRGVCSPAEAARALADIQALPLVMTPTFVLAAEALTLALAHGITAYDACYVALAQRLGVPLISADKKLLQDISGLAVVAVWLGHWTPPTATTP